MFKQQNSRYERDSASRVELSNPWSDKNRQQTSLLKRDERLHTNNKLFYPISSVSGMTNGNQTQLTLGETNSKEDSEPLFVVGEKSED